MCFLPGLSENFDRSMSETLEVSGLSPHISCILVYQAATQVLEESATQLWWAGKELQRSKKLADFVGKNEKTKLIVKLQKVSTCLLRFIFLCLASVFQK